MRESVFAMYDPDRMFLYTVKFFKICSIGTSPDNIFVIKVDIYEGMTQH